MDQVKKFLKIAVANRFWILCVVAALMPMIAFLAGNGKIKTQTEAKAKDIDAAYKGVDPYKSGRIPNPEWKSLADNQTAKLTDEINVAWKKLYERQAPLLKWPLDRVEEKFRAWGRRHPETKEASTDDVQLIIQDYINFHPEYVTSIYNSFRPFDFEKGSGVIVSPPEKSLLRPQTFEISKAPKLGDIWKEQEKLWVSRAVLAVIDEVNKNAKAWEQAPIKQIVRLEVACEGAQDPMSKTKGVALVDAPAILAPGEEAVAEETEEAGGGGYGAPAMGGMGGGMGGRMGGKGGMMEGMGGMGGGGGVAGGTTTAPEIVQFLAPPEGVENPPYFIVPIMLTVLVEQDRIADLLVELENSPMAIQVMSLDLSKPTIKVQKPEKGDTTMLGYGGNTGMMGMMGGMGRGGRGGMGGMMEGMEGGMGMAGGMGGRGGMGGMMEGMEGGMGMGMGGAGDPKKGVDVRSKDRRKEREAAEKNLANRARFSLQDPYYNVVEVSVYGQARFYVPPPPPEAVASEGDAAAEAPAEGAEKPADPAKPAEPKAAEAAPEKAEQPKADEAKPAEPKAAEAAPEKAEQPKADEAKPAEPKAAVAAPEKAEQPKADTPKN